MRPLAILAAISADSLVGAVARGVQMARGTGSVTGLTAMAVMAQLAVRAVARMAAMGAGPPMGPDMERAAEAAAAEGLAQAKVADRGAALVLVQARDTVLGLVPGQVPGQVLRVFLATPRAAASRAGGRHQPMDRATDTAA